ncbi:UDP-4-amino-4,6-dideoxy-N-acetyl-beta-L-altrosamine N-acetyltransferase [Poseidonibacter antarcticus]|uniref:UDP-4-amino-4, 6-dideoxy-N-acetyl-beta-L-altrosamine N-acetyltransferase n=1 Tax=Poseidonibacter antarcticus TaxID=2478538 RepID=UPI000EF49AD3|nr:UDP-4-amino-4,6-dideoxy-N-acetyl-beta-L-altrosamine N-acetyltransferase [Poseidonibacter antarcticus]
MNLIFKNFTELNYEEQIAILDIRNSDHVRLNMKSSEIIGIEDHIQWIEKLRLDKHNIYYSVFYNEEIVGAIYITAINSEKKKSTWGLYFKEKTNPFISSISTYLLIDKVFNFYHLNILNLEVNKKNNAAYQFDLSFGFEVIDETKEDHEQYYLMSISKEKWNKYSNTSMMKLLNNKIKKINYKFI